MSAQPLGDGATKRVLLRGAVLEMGGFGFGQALRFVSNMVLTRLLFPEAFGIAQMVFIVHFGLQMLSDLGVAKVIIQHPKGETREFLDTAFTVQAIRGVILAAIWAALSWPLAVYGFNTPKLFPYLIAASPVAIIMGLQSMATFVCRRRLQPGPPILLDVASQVLTMATTIVWAKLFPSPWANVGAIVVSQIFATIGSYFLPVRIRHRYCMDKEAREALAGFGRWVMGSSGVYFVGSRADSILLGRYMGPALLGVYSIAVMLAEAIGVVISRVINGVVYPVLSRVVREEPERLATFYYRVRLRVDALSLPLLGFLAGCGNLVVEAFWDSRYTEAGWIFRFLCIRTATTCLSLPAEACMTAKSDPRWLFYKNVVRAVTVVAVVPAGFYLAGLPGIVIATGLSEIPGLFFLWTASYRKKLLWLSREALAVGFFFGGLALGLLVHRFLPHVSHIKIRP